MGLNHQVDIGQFGTAWKWKVSKSLVVVQDLLKELDPDGVQARKAHCLKRRVYHNPGPSYSWHIDGYDKLKPWGFPIHGAIDGFSRRILWLNITRSNNSPDNIAVFYLSVVKELMSWSQTSEQKMRSLQQLRTIFETTQILIDMLLLHETNG